MDGNTKKSILPPYSLLRPRNVQWEHLIGGISGGVVATLVLHPLDLVKIRFQVSEGTASQVVGTHRPEYKGMVDAMRSITRNQGFMGLYQGVTPNVWGAGISWGFYFFFYNTIKTWMQEGNTQKNLGPGKNMLAAAEAGLFTLFITNPIWVTKTRMCLQYEGKNVKNSIYYNGMLDALIKIYKHEGMRGLYKGFVPGVFGISHGALQFMAYEEMKIVFNTYCQRPIDYRLGSVEYITFAALSKIFAATVTYPYQVVRSRLQDQHREYQGSIDCIKQIWKYEGMYGYYKGLMPNLLRVTPACCITFVVYEKMISYSKPIRDKSVKMDTEK